MPETLIPEIWESALRQAHLILWWMRALALLCLGIDIFLLYLIGARGKSSDDEKAVRSGAALFFLIMTILFLHFLIRSLIIGANPIYEAWRLYWRP